MITCLVRALRRWRPSIEPTGRATGRARNFLSTCRRRLSSRTSRCRRQQAIDGLHPGGAGLIEGLAKEFLHTRPTFDVRQGFEDDQQMPAFDGRQERRFATYLTPVRSTTRSRKLATRCLSSVDSPWFTTDARSPQRQPALAGAAPPLCDLAPDPGLAISAGIVAKNGGWRSGPARGRPPPAGYGCRKAKSSEHRARRAGTSALGYLSSRRRYLR